MDINQHLKNLHNSLSQEELKDTMFSDSYYGQQGPGGLGDEFSAPYDYKQKGALQSYYAHTADQGLESEYPEDRSNAPHLMDLELKGGILMGGAPRGRLMKRPLLRKMPSIVKRRRKVLRGGLDLPIGPRALHAMYSPAMYDGGVIVGGATKKQKAALAKARAAKVAKALREGKVRRQPAKRQVRCAGMRGVRAADCHRHVLAAQNKFKKVASEWRMHLDEVRSAFPDLAYRDALSLASAQWHEIKGTMKRERRR